jgi:WD40 repeat protein
MNAHSQDIYGVAFSPDDKYLASCSKDKTIRVYDLEKGELYKILSGHRNFVMDIEFAPDGMHLISCSFDKEIRIWEIPTGKSIYSFIDHEAEVTDLCFAPDGKSFASASYDKTIKIWNYSPEIFVDYYYSADIVDEMEKEEIFSPRRSGESKADFMNRETLASARKKQIYEEYYQKYLEELKLGKLK